MEKVGFRVGFGRVFSGMGKLIAKTSKENKPGLKG